MNAPSNHSHVMLDIESMSLHPHNALILSIGAVSFDPWQKTFTGVIGDTTRLIPSITAQLQLGREVSASTQKFWSEQPPEAAEHWRDHQPAFDNLAATCGVLTDFLAHRKQVWANGILFDLSNIDGFYRQVAKSTAPWHYRAPRDMRTFCEETPQTRREDDVTDVLAQFEIIDHEPISDCYKQILRVWQHWPNGGASEVRGAA